jgi:5-methylthioadenosine/S-adenosylhomocysteine deaminase
MIVIDNLDWILTVDPARRMIRSGRIVVDGNRIALVGKAGAPTPADATDVIDGTGLIAVPGLIDTSVAVIQQLGRGLGDLCDIPEYRLNRVGRYESALTSADARIAAQHFCVEMIRAGSTCFVDAGNRFPLEIATVAAEHGLRGLVGFAAQDIYDTAMGSFASSAERLDLEGVLERVRTSVAKIKSMNQSLVAPCIAIPWLAGCSERLGQALAKLANEHQLIVVVGAGASRDEAVYSRIHAGMTEIERLRTMGLLGPRTIVAHAGWTSPNDLRTIVDSGATVACCPSMSHRLGTGALEQGRYPELLAFGANVTLGSGSAMASNYIDIARQLYLFSGGCKTYRLDATIAGPETSLEMATARAAAALGRATELGAIEQGGLADITLFRCAVADWTPVINPVQNLVFSSRGGADTVIVAGEILLRNGVLVRVSEHEVLRNSQAVAEALAARSGLERFARSAWHRSLNS